MEPWLWKKARALRHAPQRIWRESGRPVWRRACRFAALMAGPNAVLRVILRGALASGGSGAADRLLGWLERQSDPNIVLAAGEFLSLIGQKAAARGAFRRLTLPGAGPGAAYEGLARLMPAAPHGMADLPSRLLYHHLGLGDHLVCHAIVRDRARNGEPIGLFVKHGYVQSVRFMYRDDPTIRLIAVEDDHEVRWMLRGHPRWPVEVIGFDYLGDDQTDFAGVFYHQAGLPYAQRWDGFHLQRSPEREAALFRRLVPDGGPYVFLHDDPSRGYRVDRARVPGNLPIIFPSPGLTDNVFDYCSILEGAAEIHCMDSAFRHLVDSLPHISGRLFLHHYVKPFDAPSRHPWQRLY